jgi:hypothetical protein
MVDFEEAVIQFVVQQVSKGVRVTNSSTVFDDLGLDRNDALAFMNEFSRRFDVDMSNFDFVAHFSAERMGPSELLRLVAVGIRSISGVSAHEAAKVR